MVAYGTQALLTKVADTGPAGFALQNATPTILSWTAPSDGQEHIVLFVATKHITSTETGGAVATSGNAPDGTAYSTAASFPGGQGTGNVARALQSMNVAAGSTVIISQTSALTGGASVAWCQIWAS